ncbi:MAG: hypothetical protein KDA72_20900, partial [Planctomycetales bacterium]|nr:hypothetical protein [Planctomycetales bacterium]
MNDPLHGHALLWSSRDASGIITAALGRMLRELLGTDDSGSRLLRATSDEQLNQLARTHALGLALWSVDDDSQFPHVCQSLCTVRECSPGTICVVYAELAQKDLLSVLVEAGAQLVACDVPSLQSALVRIVRVAPRSSGSLHPLT